MDVSMLGGDFDADPDYKHTLTDEIVCPYCGHQYGDSWEWNGGQAECDDDEECEECGETFRCGRRITVEYTTRRKS